MTITTRTVTDVFIRWAIRRDLAEIMEIERACFEFPWTEEDMLCVLRQRNCICMVAERQELLLGFMVYELLSDSLHILNFAVDPSWTHQSVGSQMVEKLKNKTSQQRRTAITLEIRETNLAAQLFFKKHGFKATSVKRSHYDDSEEDAYTFAYRLNECDE